MTSHQHSAQGTGLDDAPVAIFVGGTSGIGRGIAEAFARHKLGRAHIFIVGRNREAAGKILSDLAAPDDDYNRQFIAADVSLMANIEKTTREIASRYRKVNLLVLTPGILSMKGRNETKEGMDQKIALHYYARWKFVHDLIPLLRHAKERGESAQVLSVLAAGKGGKIDPDDLGLKAHYSTTAAAMAAPTYNDLAFQVGSYYRHSTPNF
jgi:NAD(P)-dependent dehydrogenase (short-subunit alcohol dehydrogenase family)